MNGMILAMLGVPFASMANSLQYPGTTMPGSAGMARVHAIADRLVIVTPFACEHRALRCAFSVLLQRDVIECVVPCSALRGFAASGRGSSTSGAVEIEPWRTGRR